MDYDEEKKFAELCVKKILNTSPRIEYDEDEMWFDYQALFDKVKCSILEVDNDIEVEHIDFSECDDYRNILFNENYEKQLSEILKGDMDAIQTVTYNFLMKEPWKHDEQLELILNYKYLIGIIAPFDQESFAYSEYTGYCFGEIPIDRKERNLFRINYSNIMKPIL